MSATKSSINFDSYSEKAQTYKLEGFDFLRAIFAIAIVVLHSRLFMVVEGFKIGSLSVVDILNANVVYIAVPVFFQISLFLFYIKSEKMGSGYLLQKRFPKLISLYFFWVISKIVFDIFLKGKSESLQNSTSSVRSFIEFIVSGGNSPLYFFFSLAFITALTEVLVLSFGKIRKNPIKIITLYSLLFISCALVFLFALLRLIPDDGTGGVGLFQAASNIAKWAYNPLNFLPYIFTTAIVVQEFNSGKLKKNNSKLKLKLYSLFFLFLIFTVLEWNYSKELLHYSRLSLVLGSWLLLYLALLSTRKPSGIVRFISGCSLGIYTFHLFFTHGFFEMDLNVFRTLDQIFPNLVFLIEFSIALIFSVLATMLFRKNNFLKDFV